MRQKHSDRIPVIVENSFIKTTAELDKHKYLVPMDLTVGQFMYVIRKRLKLDSSTTIYFIINGYIPSIGSIMKEVYESYKDKDDGFLYILVKDENVFG
jgi:GABA(A) receptor-associated protein